MCPIRAGRRPSGNPSGDSGDPVDPTARNADRSRPSPGTTSAFMHDAMNAALVPKHRDPRVLRQVPQNAEVRVARIAVIQHDRGVGQQHADEEVPHHPAGRREPEHPVAGLSVEVQVQLLDVLEQDPALPVHDRLGQAGGAGAVEHPQRMIERQRRKRQLFAVDEEPVLPAAPIQIPEPHHPLEARELSRDPLHDLRGRSPAAVAVAVDRQQHLRAPPARTGRSRSARRTPVPPRTTPPRTRRTPGSRPRSPGCSACRRPPGRPPHAKGPQAGCDRRRLRAQPPPRPGLELRATLRREPDRDVGIVLAPEHVLGVGDPEPGNHSAPGIDRSPSTTSPPASKRTSKNDTTEPQNASRSPTDHCHRSA